MSLAKMTTEFEINSLRRGRKRPVRAGEDPQRPVTLLKG